MKTRGEYEFLRANVRISSAGTGRENQEHWARRQTLAARPGGVVPATPAR